VTTVDSGVFDTSQGTVYLVLGGGGEGSGGEGGGGEGGGAGGAAWSARRDSATGYGVAVFDVNPGAEAGAQTSITVSYYHAVDAAPSPGDDPGDDPGDGGPADDYALFDTVTLVRPRSDGRRWHPKEPVASNLA
jgi:alkaline phosphatase D